LTLRRRGAGAATALSLAGAGGIIRGLADCLLVLRPGLRLADTGWLAKLANGRRDWADCHCISAACSYHDNGVASHQPASLQLRGNGYLSEHFYYVNPFWAFVL